MKYYLRLWRRNDWSGEQLNVCGLSNKKEIKEDYNELQKLNPGSLIIYFDLKEVKNVNTYKRMGKN